ncbi:MAG: hypothetical protein MJY97_02000 [Bacteroidales bacterium]|nr:hypothetical protein [Bacteroidales bacterium]
MIENEEINELLVSSYEVPFMDGYCINIYLYGSSDVKDILQSRYYDAMPEDYIDEQPSIADLPAFCLDMDDERAVFINADIVPEEERVNCFLENLYFAGNSIADELESEEFGARVIGDCFMEIAPLLSSGLGHSTKKSTMTGMAIDEYPIPLIGEDYRVTLNMYDNDTLMDVVVTLGDTYKELMMKGRFQPANNRGFVAEPSDDELAVFVNNSNADGLLMQETILVHELFHAARKLSGCLGGGEKLGARIYLTLFDQFVETLSNDSITES